jgi:hypothetical protein
MTAGPRRSPVLLLALAASACGGREAAPPPATRLPVAASPLPLRIRPGLKLSLVPNLPGVEIADVPEASRREVEILSADGRHVKLRWTGTVRVEKPESARRREEWVRARWNAPAKATPIPPVPPEYEQHEISGTLLFPDAAVAAEYLLPGLWPEGSAAVAGAAALAIPKGALAELKLRGEARVPLVLSGKSFREPASILLKRASELAQEAHFDGREIWRRATPERYPLLVDGRPVELASVAAANWFGTFEVLDDEENPLVLSVLPSPARSAVLDLFAPARVLKTLLGFRVAEVTSPAEAAR